MRDTVGLPVTGPSQVGEARRIGSSPAGCAGFDEVGRGEVATIVAEPANHFVRHAGGGDVVLSAIRSRSTRGFEVLGPDKGPGMADFQQCPADGDSTAGTPGNGLIAGVLYRDFARGRDDLTVVVARERRPRPS